MLLIGSTYLGHYCAHHQELATIILVTMLVVSFLVCCRLEVRCGYVGVVSGLQANMFRALLCPSLGARDYNVDYHIGHFVLGLVTLTIFHNKYKF